MKNKSKDDKLFFAGLICGIATALYYVVIKVMGQSVLTFCPIHEYTGYYCIGCGATRSVNELLSGNIIKSIMYYPATIYVIIFYVVYMTSNGIRIIFLNRIHSMQYKSIYMYIAAFLMIANCIIKNMILLITGTHPI